METIFLSCLFIGIFYALVSVIFGDLLGSLLDGALGFLSLDGHDWFQPMTLGGAVTVFGGAGYLLERYTLLSSFVIIVLSLLIAIVIALALLLLYVRPMKNSENSTSFSIKELSGKMGEVLTAIPAIGCGEVLIRMGAGYTNHTAESYGGVTISSGAQIVVVEVKEDVLLVAEIDLNF